MDMTLKWSTVTRLLGVGMADTTARHHHTGEVTLLIQHRHTPVHSLVPRIRTARLVPVGIMEATVLDRVQIVLVPTRQALPPVPLRRLKVENLPQTLQDLT